MTRLTTFFVAGAAAALLAGGAAQTSSRGAAFLVEHPWAGRGEWIRADTHIHTGFSDGGHTVEQVASKAVEYGCNAIAITDHADRKLRAATPEYVAAIDAVRAARPDLVVLTGMEWNVPPYGGREHASVLLPPDVPAQDVLAEFKRRFDDYDRGDDVPMSAEDALTWLDAATRSAGVRPVVVYNHPSRKDASSLENVDDVIAWRRAGDLVIGFESGPGHQGRKPYGSYLSKERPINRWDPVAARPADAWDRLLQQGVMVHGAAASSDFHNANPGDLNDYWPCQFAETWYYVPERTPAGVLRAMRAGAFYGVHGHIAREVQLSIDAPGLSRPAISGESIQVPAGTAVQASVSMVVPEQDWKSQPNHVDEIELIVVTSDRVNVQRYEISGTGPRRVADSIAAANGGLVVRARGRRISPDGDDLMFYTNAIRVSVAP